MNRFFAVRYARQISFASYEEAYRFVMRRGDHNELWQIFDASGQRVIRAAA